MARQLAFDLPTVTALGREDFFVAPSNTLALAALDGWRDWPQSKLVLSGDEGSGKTHLAHVFAAATGARIVPARDLAAADIPDLAPRVLAVEDVPAIAGDPEAERALFHLHNLCLAEGGTLLMTGAGAPMRWRIALPDLASRLQGTPMVTLNAPDDTLLAAVIAKLFADRQLAVEPHVISYLVLRIDRSFAAAREVVTQIDALSLAEKRQITRPFAARVLDLIEQGTL
ncbi:HdaA/DnaA family protein [Oceaniglobus roseus]|uniref:HdaA/DnaA family protein n=1 Tax=Oceaniglobus roseus TaxID=1737570 RepID=UPI000C7F78D0|nr:DnaA/Hda family protein [Kandeliimicrobium roseum]